MVGWVTSILRGEKHVSPATEREMRQRCVVHVVPALAADDRCLVFHRCSDCHHFMPRRGSTRFEGILVAVCRCLRTQPFLSRQYEQNTPPCFSREKGSTCLWCFHAAARKASCRFPTATSRRVVGLFVPALVNIRRTGGKSARSCRFTSRAKSLPPKRQRLQGIRLQRNGEP